MGVNPKHQRTERPTASHQHLLACSSDVSVNQQNLVVGLQQENYYEVQNSAMKS